MDDLADRTCKPCEGGVQPLSPDAATELLRALHADWRLSQGGRAIERHFEFRAWGRTIGFVNAVAWIATTEGHHPELHVTYNTVDVSYKTNAIGGLSDNDFICAAKIDRLAGA